MVPIPNSSMYRCIRSMRSAVDELHYLRFDRDMLDDVLDIERLLQFTDKCGEKALEKRVRLFIKVYGLL